MKWQSIPTFIDYHQEWSQSLCVTTTCRSNHLEIFIWLQFSCSINGKWPGRWVDWLHNMFVFSLTQVPVVHWILRISSCRLDVSKCYQLLIYDMGVYSRLRRCVLHCVHLCVLWMFMCVFYVLCVVSIDMLVISVVYTHLLITQNVLNLFLRMIIFIILSLCSVPGWAECSSHTQHQQLPSKTWKETQIHGFSGHRRVHCCQEHVPANTWHIKRLWRIRWSHTQLEDVW